MVSRLVLKMTKQATYLLMDNSLKVSRFNIIWLQHEAVPEVMQRLLIFSCEANGKVNHYAQSASDHRSVYHIEGWVSHGNGIATFLCKRRCPEVKGSEILRRALEFFAAHLN